MRVLGIDPGLRATGVALYENGTWHTDTIRVTPTKDLAWRVWAITYDVQEFASYDCCDCNIDLLVIEHMQIYPGRKQKGDPNNLIKLAMIEGAIIGTVDHSQALLPTPRAWKGGVPKKIHHKRIRERLPKLGKCSADAVDAVGLALYGLDWLDNKCQVT